MRKYILIAFITIIVAGCSFRSERSEQFEQLIEELGKIEMLLINLDQPSMKIEEAIQRKEILNEQKKTNEYLKKEQEKCDQWVIWGVAQYTFQAMRRCPEDNPGEEKQTE